MPIDNPYFLKLQAAISPIVSVGVGSAICTVCSNHGVDPSQIESRPDWPEEYDSVAERIGHVL
jgi:hypothetical protein